MNFKLLITMAMMVILSCFLGAKELSLTKQVDFGIATHEKTVVGIVKGFDTKVYEIKIKPNQTMSVNLDSDIVYFKIYSPNKRLGNDAMFDGKSQGNTFKEVLSKSGVYTVKVYLIQKEAEKDTKTIYKMRIGLK
jgi:hypothetical protein